jgi:hypothetical protein
MSSINNLLFRVAAFSMLFVAVPTSAQESDKVQELQRVNDAQQQQIEAQQRQIETLMQMVIQLQSAVEPLVTSADKERATPAEGGAPAEPSTASAGVEVPPQPSSASALVEVPSQPASQIGLSQIDRFDPDTPTASDVTYISPTALIQIPGTETSVGVHGMLQFQIAHDTSGPDSNQWNTASIPVDGAPPETKFNINPSRFVISSVTDYPGNSHLNTLISVDFNGQETVPEPRLRLAWAEYVNEDLGIGVIGGQAFPTMVDLRAVPEMLDFAIPVGAWAQRQGLLRLTKSLSETFLMEASIETPQNVRYINAEKRTGLPDAALAGTWLVNGHYLSHFKLGVLARDLEAVDVNGVSDSAFGWSVSASGKVNLPFLGTRSNLRLTVHSGDGYGTQIKGGPEEGVFDTSLDMIGISGVFGGIQHFWSDRFRSNLTFGYLSADNPATAPSDALHSSTYASANFIWIPGKRLTLGVEYLYGERKDFDGASGTSNRILLSSKLDY